MHPEQPEQESDRPWHQPALGVGDGLGVDQMDDPFSDLDVGFSVRHHVFYPLDVVAVCQGEDVVTAPPEHIHGDPIGLAGLAASVDQETKPGKVMNEAAGERIDEADREPAHASDPGGGRRR